MSFEFFTDEEFNMMIKYMQKCKCDVCKHIKEKIENAFKEKISKQMLENVKEWSIIQMIVIVFVLIA